jgi:transcription elongation factor GreA
MSDRIPMTPRGKAMLDEELKRLKSSDRPRIVKEIEIARAHGDISENAEYHAAKERQGQIEARIRLLEDRLARAQVIDGRGQSDQKVSFGATVVLSDVSSGDEVTYTIVGEDEADIGRGMISVTSPVARAIMGKERDASVRVQVPKGTREFEILEIRFELVVEAPAS